MQLQEEARRAGESAQGRGFGGVRGSASFILTNVFPLDLLHRAWDVVEALAWLAQALGLILGTTKYSYALLFIKIGNQSFRFMVSVPFLKCCLNGNYLPKSSHK